MQALGIQRARFGHWSGWVIFGAINVALAVHLLLREPIARQPLTFHTPECMAAFDRYITLANATLSQESAAEFNYREVPVRGRIVSRAMNAMLTVCRRLPS